MVVVVVVVVVVVGGGGDISEVCQQATSHYLWQSCVHVNNIYYVHRHSRSDYQHQDDKTEYHDQVTEVTQ